MTNAFSSQLLRIGDDTERWVRISESDICAAACPPWIPLESVKGNKDLQRLVCVEIM